jgi:16S rRNA C1402 (ribose-2'-O) methylase RsmI
MQTDQEARALVAPHTVGSEVAPGWTLADIAFDRGGRAGRYAFQHASGQRIGFVARRRQEAPGPDSVEDRYLVEPSLPEGETLDPRAAPLLETVRDLVRRNDAARPQAASRWRDLDAIEALRLPDPPVLYLVPGHVGNPWDLGTRAVHVLSRTDHVFVEEGTAAEARRVLGLLGIPPDGKSFAELSTDPARNRRALDAFGEVVRSDRSACLFGVSEGTPAFYDPGSDLVAEAGRLGVRIVTVGGPSALSLALMRIERDLTRFVFLGKIDSAEDVARAADEAGPLPGLPIVLFSNGRALRAHGRAFLDRLSWTSGWIVSDLTSEREQVATFDPRNLAPLDGLADGALVVLAVLPSRPDGAVARTADAARRTVSRLMAEGIRRLRRTPWREDDC